MVCVPAHTCAWSRSRSRAHRDAAPAVLSPGSSTPRSSTRSKSHSTARRPNASQLPSGAGPVSAVADSHTLVRYLVNPERLSELVRDTVLDPSTNLVHPVSVGTMSHFDAVPLNERSPKPGPSRSSGRRSSQEPRASNARLAYLHVPPTRVPSASHDGQPPVLAPMGPGRLVGEVHRQARCAGRVGDHV